MCRGVRTPGTSALNQREYIRSLTTVSGRARQEPLTLEERVVGAQNGWISRVKQERVRDILTAFKFARKIKSSEEIWLQFRAVGGDLPPHLVEFSDALQNRANANRRVERVIYRNGSPKSERGVRGDAGI